MKKILLLFFFFSIFSLEASARTCPVCSKDIAAGDAWRDHFLTAHPESEKKGSDGANVKTRTCPVCKKEIPEGPAWRDHFQSAHPDMEK